MNIEETATWKKIHGNEGACVPEHIKDGIVRYVEKGIANGPGLTAVFSNQLFEALLKCDDITGRAMFDICKFIWNHVPRGCWDSPEAVAAWVKRGGTQGKGEG